MVARPISETLCRGPIIRKGISPNFKIGWDRGIWVPGPFNLDHLRPFEPLLFRKFSNFFTFILGGQFLLPQRANMQKRNFSQLQNWMRQRGLTANSLSGQTKIIWSSVSHRKKRANSVPCSAPMSTNRRWQGRIVILTIRQTPESIS